MPNYQGEQAPADTNTLRISTKLVWTPPSRSSEINLLWLHPAPVRKEHPHLLQDIVRTVEQLLYFSKAELTASEEHDVARKIEIIKEMAATTEADPATAWSCGSWTGSVDRCLTS